ncbi:unnamed protein product [Durusdinium trenchii]|uniref:tRNA threonylcarbamoyladenosine dehydratase (T(6)A37 dehydratase) n=2 Tax=Durusdinium trenchii TaxID=1381693 RepID=A0ABP0KL50_9DINO
MAKLTSLVPQSRGGQVEPFHERRVSCAGSRPVPDPVPGVARRLVALSSVFVQRWLRARRSRRRLTCRSRQVAYDVDDPEQELQRLRFRGVSLLFGVPAFQRLQNARVAVLGIGGVGSWVVESLARSGIGALTLVDLDEICISNTNRQLHTLMDTVGRPKVDVMAERVRLINPECKVDTVQDFFVQETESQILDRQLDVVVDAIDGVANKCRLIYACRERHIPVVVSGGLGGKADPTQFCEDDITRVHGDGLTRRVRNTLRKQYGFPSGESKGRWGIPVVYSPETPKFVPDEPLDEGEELQRKTCDSGYGTFCPSAGVQGFTLAACATKILIARAK